MKSIHLLGLLFIFISVSNEKTFGQEIHKINEFENLIISSISRYSESKKNEKYRNVDVAVFSKLDVTNRKSLFSITNLINYHLLEYVNYTHIYYNKGIPVLIRFEDSIDSSDINRLHFCSKAEQIHCDYIINNYFDTTVFVTGTSDAVIYKINKGEIKETWFKMFEQLPVELWPYDNEKLINRK